MEFVGEHDREARAYSVTTNEELFLGLLGY